jgi:asparagine synthase (glutamine-hydrolysing)
MCGICGYVGHSDRGGAGEVGRAMTDSLAHRGPDGEGGVEIRSLTSPNVSGWLGHRRLRILDLSDEAHQPMLSDDGSVALVYNGETYNFRELRRELLGLGASFRSTGDTEVVLRAYEAWGTDFVRRLDGMFALAIWDAREGQLLLARDRTGKKPLYYTVADGRITFGSEIKALLQAPWIESRCNSGRLAEFLTFGYVPYPDTLYEGILQVPPASTVSFSAAGLSGPVEYWDPLPAGGQEFGQADAAEIARLLERATARRLVSDVPLGAFLSGGVDSSVVVGLMSRASTEPVRTFSIGFPEEPSFDERAHARRIAQHFATEHTEFAVEADALGLMDTLLWHHDQPYADSSAVPTYIVSRLAREHVTVALNGDGGDEVFGGYDRFKAVRTAQRLPESATRAVSWLASALPHSQGYFGARRRLERFVELGSGSAEQRYQSWIAVFNDDLLSELNLRPTSEIAASMTRHYERARDLPTLDRILYANFKTYLPDDLAVKMDRMSMANSLETRSPFLDTALIEHLAQISAKDKVGMVRVKPLLRRSLYELLPRQTWNRRKHGFGVPMGKWFRNELKSPFEDEVLAPGARTAEFLDCAVVARMWSQHQSGEFEHGLRFWTLLTLERWLRGLGTIERTPPRASIAA